MKSHPLFRIYLIGGLLLPLGMVIALMGGTLSYAGIVEPLRALAEKGVLQSVMLSLATASIATLGGMVVAIPSSYALSRWTFPGKWVIDTLLDVPVVISPVAVGMMFLFFFKTSVGAWIEEHLMRFVFEVPGIVVVQTFIVTALQIRVLKTAFDEVPVRMETVARFLGCSSWGAFWEVSLPLARPGVIGALVLGWARAMGEYGATVTVAGAIRGKTETIPIGIMLNWNAVRIEATVGLLWLLVGVSLFVLVLVRWVGGGTR